MAAAVLLQQAALDCFVKNVDLAWKNRFNSPLLAKWTIFSYASKSISNRLVVAHKKRRMSIAFSDSNCSWLRLNKVRRSAIKPGHQIGS